MTTRSHRRFTNPLLVTRFVGPAVVALLVLQAYPVLEGVRLSFTDTSLLRPRDGMNIGFENYRDLLSAPRFWQALRNTVVYTIGSVVGTLVLGFAAALTMNRKFRGRWLVRSIFTIPWAAPAIAAALVFVWMYDAQYGLVNYILETIGLIDEYKRWLNDPSLAMPAVVVATVWKIFPFAALVLLAAMQAIPEDLYEAARIDRASSITQFRHITLPSVMPTLLVLMLFVTIWSFRRFELIWIMTGGGPIQATNVLVVDLYRESFRNMRLGYGAALGVVGIVLSSLATVAYFLVTRKVQRAYGIAD